MCVIRPGGGGTRKQTAAEREMCWMDPTYGESEREKYQTVSVLAASYFSGSVIFNIKQINYNASLEMETLRM